MKYRSLVVGGGINGLCTAWQLCRGGWGPVGLVEQFTPGHRRGSSHGSTRITRSTYADATYVRLMQEAHQRAWPSLEAEVGQQLIHPGDGIFWGPPDGPISAYKEAVLEVGAPVETLSPSQARQKFPAFRFPDAKEVLWDRSGGVVAAGQAMAALWALLQRWGVGLHLGEKIVEIQHDPLSVRTESGVIEAEGLVVCAGPWAPTLLPGLGMSLVPALQTVGYWQPAGIRLEHPHFPVWVHIGRDQVHYGLPAFPGQPGIKAAFHGTSERGDDPDQPTAPQADRLAMAQNFLETQLSVSPGPRMGEENCWYTNTPTEDYILSPHPRDPRIVIGAGFSGHGFKMGPLTGRILAELLWKGESSVDAFTRDRARFRVR